MRIIFASHNENKLTEAREILDGISSEIVSKKELGISFEPEENGKSFAENAELKAVEIRNYMKKHKLLRPDDIILADDSGLCIDYLHGGPGIFSARYLGENTSYAIKNQDLIDRLRYAEGEERKAHFTCNICAAFADGRLFHTEGIFPGLIAEEAKGENGFGYDPILYLPEYGRTSAELTSEEKNKISHRGRALREMRRVLQSVLLEDEKISERLEGLKPEREIERVLVVSDTHRIDEPLLEVIRSEKPFEYFIHLGDGQGVEDWVAEELGSGVKCYFVRGNCDEPGSLSPELEVRLGKHRCFLTHGDFYGVSYGVGNIAAEARDRNCDVAMFGHTHVPFQRIENGVLCLNPGSLSAPRQADRRRSYLILTILPDGELKVEKRYL